jgi:hypothetical protein
MGKLFAGVIAAVGVLIVTGCSDNPIQNVSSSSGISQKVATAVDYQAETALLENGANTNTNHSGYTGSGFVDGYFNNANAKTTFSVNVGMSGQYPVTLRYSAGNAQSTANALYVNGTFIKNITCPKTTNWDTWNNQVENVTLYAGKNTIAYKSTVSTTSCINLDKITVGDVICNVSFTMHPSNYMSICGSTNWVSFSVQVQGSTWYTYQWYYNYDNGPTGSLCNSFYFTGGTTATVAYAPQSEIYIWCVVTSACGTQITSNRAHHTISVPTITMQPSSGSIPCGSSDSLGFTVQAQGATDFYYQWYYNFDNSTTGYLCNSGFAGGNTDSLMCASDQTKYVWCEITAACGTVLTSAHAKMTVCR